MALGEGVIDIAGVFDVLQDAPGRVLDAGSRRRREHAEELRVSEVTRSRIERNPCKSFREEQTMPRPVTLFSGQWADLAVRHPLRQGQVLRLRRRRDRLLGRPLRGGQGAGTGRLLQSRWDILNKHGLQCFAISNHLVGQAVCDRIDERHKSILPPRIWGDGKEDGVRARAAEEMKNTARAPRQPWGQGRARLHRLADLAHGLLVPAQPARFPGEGAGALCRAVDADPGCLPGSGRQVRPGSPPHRDRLRHCQRRERAGCGEAGTRPSASTTIPATSAIRASTTWPSSASSPTASSTST